MKVSPRPKSSAATAPMMRTTRALMSLTSRRAYYSDLIRGLVHDLCRPLEVLGPDAELMGKKRRRAPGAGPAAERDEHAWNPLSFEALRPHASLDPRGVGGQANFSGLHRAI